MMCIYELCYRSGVDVASLIISIVALVIAIVALPPIFQMYCGGPKIKMIFNQVQDDAAIILRCGIQNAPITNRFLRVIRVRREPTSITAAFSVHHAEADEVVAKVIPKLFGRPSEQESSIVLFSPIPAYFPVAQREKDRTGVVDLERKQGFPLEAGKYYVDVNVYFRDDMAYARKHFLVGSEWTKFYWEA